MSAQTIEEAYLVLVIRTDDDIQAEARALALAVFWSCYVNHYPCTRDELCGMCAARLAKIEALGR
jgi:hypothetical protein